MWLLLLAVMFDRNEAFSGGDLVFSDDPMTWSEARKWCTDKRMKQVSIHSQFENDVIANHIELKNALHGPWIGLQNDENDASSGWSWSDGTSLDYQNWKDPTDDSKSGCVIFGFEGWLLYEHENQCSGNLHRALCYPPNHWIAAGNPASSKWTNVQRAECKENSAIESTAVSSGAFDHHIAVSCCNTNGEYPTDDQRKPSCDSGKTYREAVKICADKNKRLCTLQEMFSQFTQGTGCSFDYAYNWVSDYCEPSNKEHVFLLGGEKKTWQEAEDYCASHSKSKHLVSIHSNEHAVAALNKCNSKQCWIGLHSSQSDNTNYEWSDGWQFSYSFWILSNTQKKYQCVRLARSLGVWKDTDCKKKKFLPLCGGGASDAAAGSMPESDPDVKNHSAYKPADDLNPLVLGAAVGALVMAIATVILLVMRRRRKSAAEGKETEMSKVVGAHNVIHVEEGSIGDAPKKEEETGTEVVSAKSDENLAQHLAVLSSVAGSRQIPTAGLGKEAEAQAV